MPCRDDARQLESMLRSSLASALLALLAPVAAAQSTWFVDLAGVAPGTGTAQDPYTSI